MCFSKICCTDPNQGWLHVRAWLYDKDEYDETIDQDKSFDEKQASDTPVLTIVIEKTSATVSPSKFAQ